MLNHVARVVFSECVMRRYLTVCVCRLAGAAGTTVTCPLEVVKTRLQVGCKRISQKEGY